MRYTAATYARAFAEAGKEIPEEKRGELVRRFVQVIGKNGDLSRGKEIVSAVTHELAKSKGGKMVDIEIARELPKSLEKDLTKHFTPHDCVSIIPNPSLLAGVRITFNGERELDNSLKRKLKKLFV